MDRLLMFAVAALMFFPMMREQAKEKNKQLREHILRLFAIDSRLKVSEISRKLGGSFSDARIYNQVDVLVARGELCATTTEIEVYGYPTTERVYFLPEKK